MNTETFLYKFEDQLIEIEKLVSIIVKNNEDLKKLVNIKLKELENRISNMERIK